MLAVAVPVVPRPANGLGDEGVSLLPGKGGSFIQLIRHSGRVNELDKGEAVADNERLVELFKDLVDNYLRSSSRRTK